jgi:hypothetical protein
MGSVRPSGERLAYLQQRIVVPTVSNFYPLERYYSAADKLYDVVNAKATERDGQLLDVSNHTLDCYRALTYEQLYARQVFLDECYMLGKRYCIYFTDAISSHNYYNTEKFKSLQNKHAAQLQLVIQMLERVVDCMDQYALYRQAEEQRAQQEQERLEQERLDEFRRNFEQQKNESSKNRIDGGSNSDSLQSALDKLQMLRLLPKQQTPLQPIQPFRPSSQLQMAAALCASSAAPPLAHVAAATPTHTAPPTGPPLGPPTFPGPSFQWPSAPPRLFLPPVPPPLFPDAFTSPQSQAAAMHVGMDYRSQVEDKAWKFVERVLAMVDEMSKVEGSLVQAVASDSMFYVAKRMISAQQVFHTAGKPTVVDLGYHYTLKENMDTIRSGGLMSSKERAAKGLSAAQNNGAKYGNGIYTATNPCAWHGRYGDVGLVVARLQGANANFHPARANTSNQDSVTVERDNAGECVILASSQQCIPILQFDSSQISRNSHVHPGNMLVTRYHVALQTLIDETFNDKARPAY